MNTKALILTALALCGAGVIPAAAADDDSSRNALKVKKLGFQVIEEDSELMRGKQRGTTVWFQLTAPDGKRFIDSKGTTPARLNCQDGAGQKMKAAEYTPFFSEISEDGRVMCIEVKTPDVSPDGTLRLSGMLPVTLSSGMEKQEAVALTLTKGRSIRTAGYTISVDEVEQDEGIFSVSFNIKGKEEPAYISFTTTDGEKLVPLGCSQSVRTFGNKMEAEFTFRFDRELSEVRLSVSTWATPETIECPLKARVRLGGGKSKTK